MSVHGRDGGPAARDDVEHLNDVEGAQTVTTTDDVDALTDHSDGELQSPPRQASHVRPVV